MKQNVFNGPFFDYVLGRAELKGARLFAQGSSAIILEKDARLYRLTSDGSGHNLISELQMIKGAAVVRFINDFGPVAPMDDCPYDDSGILNEYYWLAEVERLQDLDMGSPLAQNVADFLGHYSDNDIIDGPDLVEFSEKMKSDPFQAESDQIRALEFTLRKIVDYVMESFGTAVLDFRADNIMIRPKTNELVWSDPIWGGVGVLTDQQEEEMKVVRSEFDFGSN